MTGEWKPLWETGDLEGNHLRRVIMAGYTRGGKPHVGEAFWGDPDERGRRWIWADAGDVKNPLGFQNLPDFPIPEQSSKYTTGKSSSV